MNTIPFSRPSMGREEITAVSKYVAERIVTLSLDALITNNEVKAVANFVKVFK